MPSVYYQIRTLDGRFVHDGNNRPVRYRTGAQALERALWFSSYWRSTAEIVRFPKPYKERRFINA